jgi:hypothetical protein
MINRKINRLLSSVLGIALTTGIIQMPAFADDNVQVTSSYSSSDNLTNDQTNIANKDKNIEQNGLKISVNKIVASKHKLIATIIVKNENSFDKTKRPNPEVLLSYGDNKSNGQSVSSNYTDDKTLVITITRNINKGELPEKGPLRIDLVIPTYKINLGIDENMDFSEAFKDSIEKDLSINVPDCNFTINKLESDLLGTHITFSKIEKDSSDKEYNLSEDPSLILKTGDKMYLLRPSGPYSSNSSGNGKDNKVILGGYESEPANYENIKDQSNISMTPIICNMTSNELDNYYKEFSKNRKNSMDDTLNKDILNNVYYTKTVDFSDGTKGEIYNVERNKGVIKVYCKGATEKESLLMASNTNIRYKSDGSKTYNSYYSGNTGITFSKDPNVALGYILEFTGVDEDKTIELTCDTIIKQIDKFNLGNEIQLSK